ncbi:MAG: hypothetical protein HYR56_05540 [Acidobacteria bacterium]|nr:hypothetical protein [Acidobacteriota bacterium]MBI3427124.1 hypothetical protein [Acidobacteriota bacterium]
MQIASSNIQLSSTRIYAATQQSDERLRVWTGNHRPDFEATEPGHSGTAPRRRAHDAVAISAPGRQAHAQSAATQSADGLSSDDEAKLLLLEKVIEQLTGKKLNLHLVRPADLKPDPQTEQAAAELAKAGSNAPAGFGVEYDRVERSAESEQTTFSATGVVRTTDGKEIKFNVDLNLSRSFVTQNEEHLRLGDAVRKDPLVINFNGTAAQLTTDKISFDLDADGSAEQISFVKPGSGFLALDKNGDGRINNGSELFGPTTGDGFGELAAYDTDGNQWIDEGDAVFNKLRVWTKDAAGNDSLLSLKQAGVGALNLSNVATQFSLNDTANQQLGQIQSTGIWLGEQGGAGTIQHVDLVV